MNYKKITYGLCELCATPDDEQLLTLTLLKWLQLHCTTFITLLLLSMAAWNW